MVNPDAVNGCKNALRRQKAGFDLPVCKHIA
jgi:hypothetical protein